MGETHLRNLGGLSDVQVIVVADPNLQAGEYGKRLSGAEIAPIGVEQAISHQSVDAVVIVAPTDTHARLIELAVRAGKAVFSEDPIALDLKEAKIVVDLIGQSKAPVQLGFMRRYDPGYVSAKQRIDAGELGRIETFRALSRDTYPPSLKFLRQSGGLFLDMAVHDLVLARFLVGEVEEVYSWGTVFIDSRFAVADDVDTAATFFRFVNRAVLVVVTSRLAN